MKVMLKKDAREVQKKKHKFQVSREIEKKALMLCMISLLLFLSAFVGLADGCLIWSCLYAVISYRI